MNDMILTLFAMLHDVFELGMLLFILRLNRLENLI